MSAQHPPPIATLEELCSPEKLWPDAEPMQRLRQLVIAAEVLPKDYDFAGRSDRDFMLEALEALRPDEDFASKSDAYLGSYLQASIGIYAWRKLQATRAALYRAAEKHAEQQVRDLIEELAIAFKTLDTLMGDQSVPPNVRSFIADRVAQLPSFKSQRHGLFGIPRKGGSA